MKKKMSKKILSLLLAAVMTLGLMPITASAATGTISIGGNNNLFLSYNQGNLSTYGWEWDASSNTIMLNSSYDSTNSITIDCVNTDEIKLVYDGDVTINSFISCNGSLEISGSSGTLTVGTSGNIANEAIYAYEDITISGDNTVVKATGDQYGIYSGQGSIELSGGAVTVTGGTYGILSDNGSTTISGGADVTVTGTSTAGIYSETDTIIKGANTKLKVTSNAYGIWSDGNTKVDGGTVEAVGNVGLYSAISTIISGGTITVSGNMYDIYGKLIITGGSLYLENSRLSSQPTNGTNNVYLNTLDLDGITTDGVAITGLSIDGVANSYGIDDVVTDSTGKLYFWFTETTDSELVTATANGSTYTAYYTRLSGSSINQTLYSAMFTVSFDTNGGNSVASQSLYYGAKVSAPTDPTKSGYDFGGWYKDSGLSAAWDFNNDTITSSITLYAKWVEIDADTPSITVQPQSISVTKGNTATLTVDASVTDGGSLSYQWYSCDENRASAAAISGANGESYSPSTSATSTSYYYVLVTNTNTAATGSATASTQSNVVTLTVTSPTGVSTDISYYTLSFNTNGGTSIDALRRASGTRIDISQYKPSREGYTFDGWYSDASLTTQISSVTLSSNTTVYAKWTADAADTDTDAVTHEPYISGYTDGTFRPDSSISRAEVAQLLYNISGANASGTNQFSDVTSGAWYDNAVTTLASKGVISGYTDGTFKPDSEITRAEFVALVVRYAGLSEASGNAFSDVSSDNWAAGYISAAAQAGYISGYTDGTFRPDSSITRAEAVTILNAMLGREIEASTLTELSMPFSDVPTNHWAYEQILEAAVGHEHE